MGDGIKTYEGFDNSDNDENQNNDEPDLSGINVFGGGVEGNQKPKSKTPFIDNLGRDFTKMAEDGKISPVIGREKEVEQIIWILARKNKNNPIIIGEPGVGKTAIVEGIANMIVSKNCPESLENKRIIGIDMASIMAGSSKQGELESRVKQLMKELEANPDVIIFIDEIHLIKNDSLSIDVSNIMKPALARGEMRCIGATTYKEFKETLEKDGALVRRFQKVNVDPTTVKDTIVILQSIKEKYELHHKVSYSDDAVIACVKLSDKYITDRFFPDKAIDLLDEVGAKIRISRKKNTPPEIIEVEVELQRVKDDKERFTRESKYEEAGDARKKEVELENKLIELGEKYTNEVEITEVTESDVENILSIKTGIPVTKLSKDEGTRLLNLENELSIDIIGQSEAVSTVAKCIRRSRSGLKDPNRPNGVFLFLGSTGVGKTHTVKTLAKHLFTSEKDVIRIDMSEFGAEHNVARLIGSPPGYVGYGEGGQLTEKVRRKPYSIVLLDEIEKAHPKVLDVLLQVFDDGHLTDGEGTVVDFKNTIIVMTSNIGTKSVGEIMDPVGFGTSSKSSVTAQETRTKKVIEKELKKALRPEFINRIDDIIIFNSLNREAISRIVKSEVGKLEKKLDELGYGLSLSDSVMELLLEEGYDEEMGARPLRRAIQKFLEDPISDVIIKKDVEDGDTIEVDYNSSTKKMSINGNIVSEKLHTKFKDFVNS